MDVAVLLFYCRDVEAWRSRHEAGVDLGGRLSSER